MNIDVVDKILDSVLGLVDYGMQTDNYFPVASTQGSAVKQLIMINPETEIVISKSQLDITNEIKALSAMADKINDTSAKVTEVHARMTNDIPKKEKPLTKKQREKAELEAMLAEAHNRVRANGYTIK